MNNILSNAVGHTLRTPLTAIYGFSQLLEDEKVLNNEEIRKHYLGLICKNSQRLNSAILMLQELLTRYDFEINEDEKNKLLGIQELQK